MREKCFIASDFYNEIDSIVTEADWIELWVQYDDLMCSHLIDYDDWTNICRRLSSRGNELFGYIPIVNF